MTKWKTKTKVIVAVTLILLITLVIMIPQMAGAASAGYREIQPQIRDLSTYLEFSGNIETSNDRNIYALVSAQVLEVKVEKGDEVKAGDVLAVLDASDAEYNIALKEAALKASQTSDYYNVKDSQTTLDHYTEAVESGRDASTNSAQKALLAAQTEYQTAVENYNRAKADLDAGTTSSVVSAKQSMQSQNASYASAVAQHDAKMITDEALETYRVSYENARQSYDLAVSNARQETEDYKEKMDQAQASLAKAETDYETGALTSGQSMEKYENSVEKAQALSSEETTKLEINHLKESLDDYVICAPMDGVVTQLDVKAGDMTTVGTKSIAQIADFSVMQVAVKMDEQDVGSAQTGDAVSVYVDALNKTYDGKISSIARTATIDNNAVYVKAVVEFKTDASVRSNFSAEVKLVKDKAAGAVCIPADAVQTDVDHTAYIYIKDAKGKPEKRSVTLGLSDGTYTQITEGLSAEETVLAQTASAYPMPMGMELSKQASIPSAK